jgi:uncharacterized damage-inducible protein DinB
MPASVPPVSDERDALLAYLAHQRYLVTTTAHGLTEEQARMTPTASSLSVGGLIKHLTRVERNWMDIVLQRPHRPLEQTAQEFRASFHLSPTETLDGVLRVYAIAAEETDEVIAGVADLGQVVPVPHDQPWFPRDIEAWSVRWVLLHLIEETARHLGHADVIRESIDGATAIPLLAAREGWDETPWVKPWRAPVAAA